MKQISNKNALTRLILPAIWLALLLPIGTVVTASEAYAVTTANITITVTPGVLGISCNVSSYDYGNIVTSGTSNTSISYFGITNTSTVITNHSIGVTGATWTGGATAWTHSNTATPGADTVGLNANRGGTWGTGDVIIKSSALNNIYANCPATTNYDFGLGILMPTSTTVADQKTNVVQITVSAA